MEIRGSLGEYPLAWRPVTPALYGSGATIRLAVEATRLSCQIIARTAEDMRCFLEAYRLSIVDDRRVPISKPEQRPFPTRKGLRTEKAWHR